MLLNKVKLYLKKLLERLVRYLARPRKLKYGEGEIILKNLSKEEADKIVAMISGNTVSTQVVETTEQEELEPVTNNMISFNEPMTGYGCSLVRDNNNYQIVELNFNKETKQAVVVNVKEVGTHKGIAEGEFKVLISNKFL